VEKSQGILVFFRFTKFLSYFPYFETIKEGLCDRLAVCVFSCPPKPLKAGIVEPEEISVAMQRLGKYVHAALNTHATLELFDAVSSVRSATIKYSVCSEKKVVDYCFPKLFVIYKIAF
jgi:hypothetical protein